MVALRRGLVGEEQGTLLSQFKLQRQESKDKLDELIHEFKNFAAHMVENNQKAIIEALQQVISDFNKNLTEQFGENFKQLNQAVEKLVVWQLQYKEELEALKIFQKSTSEDMRSAAESFRDLLNKAESFSEIADHLRQQLDLLKAHGETLYQQERSLADVLSTMKDVTPTFGDKVSQMLSELRDGMQKTQDTLKVLTKDFSDNAANLQAEVQKITKDAGESFKQVHTEMAASTKNFGVQVQSANAEMKNMLADVLKSAQKDLGEGLSENSRIIKEGVLALDKALQKELNDSLETLGRQLASLSQKFVEDYTPLTERLRDLVQVGRG